MNIASQIRHFLTFLAGLGGLFLSWQIIAPDQVAAVDKAGADLIDPLIIIIGAVAAGLARLALGWIGSLIGLGAGELGNKASGFPVWVGLIATAALVGVLPSCSPAQMDALRAVPIRVGVETPDSRVSYSSKGGLVVEARVVREK
jgi:hypothetical protein